MRKMGMQLVLLVLKLCIPVVSSLVHGSTGYNISPSPAIFAALPPVQDLGHHEKSPRTNTPIASPVPNGSVLHSPMVSPPHMPAPVPRAIQGLVPSMPPSHPIVKSSHKSALLSPTMSGLVPTMPSNPPIVVPSHEPASVPQVIQGVVPSMPPSPPIVVEPSHKLAPLPQTMPGLVPSMSPSLPVVVPSHKPAPVPQTIQGLPSIPPSPPKVVPSHKSAPVPHTIPGLVPSMPPSPLMGSSPHKLGPMPQTIHGLVAPIPPSPPIIEPSHNSAPLPQTIPGLVPSMPRSPPIVLPPHKLAPVHQTIQELVPSMPPRPSVVKPTHKSTPLPQTMPVPSMPPSVPIVVPSVKSAPVPSIIVEPSHKSAPLSQTMPGLVPSMPPSPPIVVPSQNSGPFPQPIEGLVPSMQPNPPMVEPSHKSAPLPQTMSGIVPSAPPSLPIVSPPHKPAPMPQTVKGLVPSMPPSPQIVEPSHKSAPLSETLPGLVPSMPPSPPIVVPSHKSAPLPQTMSPSSPIAAPLYKPAPLPQTMTPSPPIVVPSHKSAPWPQTMPPSSPIVVPLHKPAPLSQTMPGLVPTMPPISPIVVPSHKSAPLPQVMPGFVPSMPPSSPIVLPSHKLAPLPQTMPPNSPIAVPVHKPAPLPQTMPGLVPAMPPTPSITVPSHKSASLLQPMPGLVPSMPPIASLHGRAPDMPVAAAPTKSPRKPSDMHPTMPGVAPSLLSEPALSPTSAPLRSISRNSYGMPVAAAPPKETFSHLSPMNHFPNKAPTPHKTTRPSNHVPAPSSSLPKPPESKWADSPASSPVVSSYNYHHARKRASSPAPAPSYLLTPPTSYYQGPIIPPALLHPPTAPPRESRRWHHHPPPVNHGPSVSPVQPPYSSTVSRGSPAPLPSSTLPSGQTKRPVLPPTISPSGSPPRKPKTLLPSPIQALPPPPPNHDCISQTCTEPFTNSPPGSPCACVWPMQVGLSLSVALYTFFPLVSELAEEIAAGVLMKQSQVRIMGANAASQQLDKTIVLIDLVPLGESFDYTTAFLTYEKFWHKQVPIKTSFFGDYEVLYVHYPGLPPSPPLPPSSTTIIDGEPYTSHGNNARTIHPIGVNVRRKQKGGLGGSTIAIIILSSFIAMALCIGAAWFLVLKCEHRTHLSATTPRALVPSLRKQAGAAGSLMFGSGLSSASLSFGSSIAAYAGSAKTFSADEIERATDNFANSRVLGEGGFGRVYEGILDDGMKVAVKVLKRDDQQGGREFLAEVEMLSRLHHRNLVKLIGICVEDHTHCLIYELIPNGSVESHLHGVDKETAPLDWGARMKIALGSARGLAYLHEDSSPHVIHRDFKSSNILLEHDFTPKVADFGLARTALDEANKHISTRVMGTFGYVAPEYAMTGHLLVKSDVYSYGVVLLELLTGRKPVDMSQPPGQENLVTWARPLLTSKEGLEMIIDRALGSNFPFDSIAKVSAIASMCVQPEVSHRPFMGEVVQALKLVCDECDDTKEAGSESCVREDSSIVDIDARTGTGSGQLEEPSCAHYPDYDSSLETGRALSASDIFNSSARFGLQTSGPLRNFSSGPLRIERNRRFWQRVRSLSRGSNS